MRFEGGGPEERASERVAVRFYRDTRAIGETVHECKTRRNLHDVKDLAVVETGRAEWDVFCAGHPSWGPGEARHEGHHSTVARGGEQLGMKSVEYSGDGFLGRPLEVRTRQRPEGLDEGDWVG